MVFQGREVIMWAINNYLGLAGNAQVKETARQALERWGTFTPMGSLMLTGNTSRHQALERELAEFLQKPAAVIFNYGYLGVLGTISALVGPTDVILMDRLSHASIVDATLLASAGRRFHPFKHNDMDNLEFHLKAANRDHRGGLLIVTEGVYGMRGDLADLKNICELKERYGARLYVDDAHGFGVMGPNGRGTGEQLGVHERIDLYFGTLAKAFAAIGGVTAGEEQPVRYMLAWDFLEHLPNREVSDEVLRRMLSLTAEAVWLRMLSFEDVDLEELRKHGLRPTWTTWKGHTSHYRLSDVYRVVAGLDPAGRVFRVTVNATKRAQFSDQPWIVPLEAPAEVQKYEVAHGARPLVTFRRAVVAQRDVVIVRQPGSST